MLVSLHLCVYKYCYTILMWLLEDAWPQGIRTRKAFPVLPPMSRPTFLVLLPMSRQAFLAWYLLVIWLDFFARILSGV